MKNPLGKKAMFFGLLGLVGCVGGWGVGELFLKTVAIGSGGDAAATATLVSHEAPPPLPQGFESLAGTGNGDIKLMLKWHTRDDLDLHCIDPSGARIFFGNRHS